MADKTKQYTKQYYECEKLLDRGFSVIAIQASKHNVKGTGKGPSIRSNKFVDLDDKGNPTYAVNDKGEYLTHPDHGYKPYYRKVEGESGSRNPIKPGELDRLYKTFCDHGYTDKKVNELNIAIVTGKDTGVIIIDIDGPIGKKSLEILEGKYGKLPEAPILRTGRKGGYHLLFQPAKKANGEFYNMGSNSNLGPCIDYKADNGYSITAPSLHWAGNTYKFDEGYKNVKVSELPVLPKWVVELVMDSQWYNRDDGLFEQEAKTAKKDSKIKIIKTKKGKTLAIETTTPLPEAPSEGFFCKFKGYSKFFYVKDQTYVNFNGNKLFYNCPNHVSTTKKSFHIDYKSDSKKYLWYCHGCGVGGRAYTPDEYQTHIEWLANNQTNTIVEDNNCLYLNKKFTDKKTGTVSFSREKISNFTIDLKYKIKFNQIGDTNEIAEWHYIVDMTNEDGVVLKDKYIPTEAFLSDTNFRKHVLKANSQFLFYGNTKTLTYILAFIGKDIHSYNKGYNYCGLIKQEGKWGYLDESYQYGFTNMKNGVSYMGKREDEGNDKLLDFDEITKEELEDIIPFIFSTNAADVILPMYGWAFYQFVSIRMNSFNNDCRNPILLGTGTRGDGKTVTMMLMLSLFGVKSARDTKGVTIYTIGHDVRSNNLIPTYYDEYRDVDMWSQVIRALYDRMTTERGDYSKTTRIERFPHIRPVVLTGEIGINDPAVTHRKIEIKFGKKKREGCEEAWEEAKGKSLTKIGTGLLKYTLSLSDKNLSDIYAKAMAMVSDEIDDREKDNTAAQIMGWILFVKYCEKLKVNRETLIPILQKNKDGKRFYEVICENMIETKDLEDKSIIEQTLEVMENMIEKSKLKWGKHYIIKEINGKKTVCLNPPLLFTEISKFLREYDLDIIKLDRITFLKQVKETPYFLEHSKIVNFGEGSKRALVLDCEILKKQFQIDFEKAHKNFLAWIVLQEEKDAEKNNNKKEYTPPTETIKEDLLDLTENKELIEPNIW